MTAEPEQTFKPWCKIWLLAIQLYHPLIRFCLRFYNSLSALPSWLLMHFHHLWQTGSLPAKQACFFFVFCCYSAWQLSMLACPIRAKMTLSFPFDSLSVDWSVCSQEDCTICAVFILLMISCVVPWILPCHGIYFLMTLIGPDVFDACKKVAIKHISSTKHR